MARRLPAVAVCGGALAQVVQIPMTRTHRMIHRALWPALIIIVALGFTLALALRLPPAEEAPPVAQTQPSTSHP